MPPRKRDPVERALGRSRDLYDVATWEPRTAVDRLAVRLTGAGRAGSRWLVILAALAILVAQVAIIGFTFYREPWVGGFVLLSVVPAAILAGFIWYRDPTLRQSLRSLVVTFVLGVLFAGFAAVLNSVFGAVVTGIPLVGMALFFFLVVGPVEEFVKWLAIRLHAFRADEFDTVVDGAVYGAVAGLGFATIENAVYVTRFYLEAVHFGAEPVFAAAGITGARALAGPGHVIYAGIAGYYLGLAKFNPDHRGPIAVKGLLLAAVAHGFYNTAVTYLPQVVDLSLVGFFAVIVVYDGVLLLYLLRKISRYRSAFHAAMEPDLAPNA